jgi:hypothetical protein
MHEYPCNPTFDSVSERRVNALAEFGFTQRQREFLVTVMVRAGCFLERQYCAFTGTARGQNSREFVARLVARGFARAIEPRPVRRGRLYHVHHKPLYEAIALPDDRNRRLHSIGRMVERAMILDAVLGDRRCWWLSPAEDERTFFNGRETGLRDEEYPHMSFGAGRDKIIRCFPDKLPIGVDKEDTGRFVFLYLVTRRILIDFGQALREQLWTPLDPSVSKALETYFRQRKERGGHLGEPGDRFIAREFRRQGMAKIAALYRAWQREGDVVLWRSSSTSFRDDRMHGCSACEVQDLNAQYLQLTKALDREAWAKKGAKPKSRQVGPPVSAPSHDVLSPLVAP